MQRTSVALVLFVAAAVAVPSTLSVCDTASFALSDIWEFVDLSSATDPNKFAWLNGTDISGLEYLTPVLTAACDASKPMGWAVTKSGVTAIGIRRRFVADLSAASITSGSEVFFATVYADTFGSAHMYINGQGDTAVADKSVNQTMSPSGLANGPNWFGIVVNKGAGDCASVQAGVAMQICSSLAVTQSTTGTHFAVTVDIPASARAYIGFPNSSCQLTQLTASSVWRNFSLAEFRWCADSLASHFQTHLYVLTYDSDLVDPHVYMDWYLDVTVLAGEAIITISEGDLHLQTFNISLTMHADAYTDASFATKIPTNLSSAVGAPLYFLIYGLNCSELHLSLNSVLLFKQSDLDTVLMVLTNQKIFEEPFVFEDYCGYKLGFTFVAPLNIVKGSATDKQLNIKFLTSIVNKKRKALSRSVSAIKEVSKAISLIDPVAEGAASTATVGAFLVALVAALHL